MRPVFDSRTMQFTFAFFFFFGLFLIARDERAGSQTITMSLALHCWLVAEFIVAIDEMRPAFDFTGVQFAFAHFLMARRTCR